MFRNFYSPKLSCISHSSAKSNRIAFALFKNYTSEASLKDKEIKKSNKWGYTREENGFKKHNKNTTGLYHLGTISLPEQLEKNLNSYLKKFPSKHLVEDAIQLSKHLQNRGRPTERTWSKYKEAKSARKQLRENVEEDELCDGQAVKQISQLDGEDVLTPTFAETARHIEKTPRSHLTKKPKMQEYKIIRYKKREAAAYLADRAIASYGATLRVLHEIAKREAFKPETVLDFGSGVGTATWAAHEVWKDSIKVYQCVDVSREMNETAEYLLRGSNGYRTPSYIPRIYFKEYLPATDTVTYDVVMASYSLSEIPFSRARQEILENLWRKTNYFLVIVERGNNEGFDITMQARDLVTENQNEVNVNQISTGVENDGRLSGYVFSPCPHELVCPRSDVDTRDHPCNFEQRVQLSFAQRQTSLKKYGYYNEMFSYLVLCKAERTTKDLDWARLLRPVRLREKHVICNFCSKNGSLEQRILTKRKNSDIYKCVRHRAKWGDLLPVDVDRTDQVDEKQNMDT